MRPLGLILVSGHPLLGLIGLILGFLPAIIAFARNHRHPWVIFFLCFLFWTGFVWLGCLIWASVGRPRHLLTGPPAW